MNQSIIERYGLETAVRSLPKDRADLFLHFTAWPDDVEGFARQSLTRRPHGPIAVPKGWDVVGADVAKSIGPLVPTTTREIWNQGDTGRRALIEIDECASAADAIAALGERLEWNQLARLDDGPSNLGMLSFVHPKGVPSATLFVRGNLCVSVSSFGAESIAATRIAEALDARLTSRPEVDRETISVTSESGRSGVPPVIRFSSTWQVGSDGFIAIDVRGGAAMLLENGRIAIPSAAEVHVRVHALEPGREPHAGSFAVNPAAK
jgi:hypothetical protein